MSAHHSRSTADAAVTSRFGALAPLAADELNALSAAHERGRKFAAQREIMTEGERVAEPSVLLAGWACRSRMFLDGRRQVLSLLLPGDLVGMCRQSHPVAATGVLALTEVTLCPAPTARSDRSGLAEAYARAGALEEAYLFRQVTRLGRMSAYERMIDLLLELRDRLVAVGLGTEDSFPLPVTQETLADLLGLSNVHLNRTLTTLRRDGLIDLRRGAIRLMDLEHLTQLVDYRPAVVAIGGARAP